METITLTIDGNEVKARKGATVLEAAQQVDIYVPTLCAHKHLSPFGACRLCIVEIENMRGLPPSCSVPATDGMVVKTRTPQIVESRRNIMEFILSEHPHACLTCHRNEFCGPFDVCLRHVGVSERCVTCHENEHCELQKVARELKLKEVRLPYRHRGVPIIHNDPFFDRDYNLCILCGRCVRVCQDIRGAAAVAFTYRGSQALVGTAFGRSLEDSDCQFCGACVDACPCGALAERQNRWAGSPDRTVTSTCPFCGVGCTLDLQVKDGKLMGSVPQENAIVNEGQACVKGRFGMDFVNSPDRLTTPLIRKDGQFIEASWDEALDLVASKLSKHRGDEFAAISSAKATNEENYVIQKFARAVMGTNSVDHCARL